MNSSFYLLATICFIAMISPGPDFVLVTKNSLLHSKRLALATAVGIVCGCLFHATYCTLGLALIITKSTVVFSIIRYAGACYLIYLGLKGLLAKHSQAEHLEVAAGNRSMGKMFLDGFLCNVLNPKLALFLLSLFTQFIAVDATVGDKALVAAIFVIEAALYWPSLVLLLQSARIRKAFARFRKTLDRVCGGLLLFLGLRVAIHY